MEEIDVEVRSLLISAEGFRWRRSFTGFVEGFGRICGLKGKNKVKWPLSPNMLRG